MGPSTTATTAAVLAVLGLACCGPRAHAFVSRPPAAAPFSSTAVAASRPHPLRAASSISSSSSSRSGEEASPPVPGQAQAQAGWRRRHTAFSSSSSRGRPLWMSMRPEGDDMMMGGGAAAGGGGGGGGGGGMGDLSPVNHVMLIGRLGAEPAVKYMDSGNCVLAVSLAVAREMAPGRVAMGEQQEVDWIRLEAWGRQAEAMAQNARKGSRVMVVGRLVTGTWTDKYGQTRSDVKVRVKRVEVLMSPRDLASGNPELKYYSNWAESGAGAGADTGASSLDLGDYGGGGGGGATGYGRGGGGGGGMSSSSSSSSPYARRGGAASSSSSPYAKKKSTWNSSGGRQASPYGGGYGSQGGGAGGGGGGAQQQPPPSQAQPPAYDALGEYEVDTDIPF